MFQKGPGEGYGAAKQEALALNPALRCRRCVVPGMGSFHRVSVLTQTGPKKIGEGKLARDAWADAVSHLRQDPRQAALDAWLGAGSSPNDADHFMAGWDSMIARDTNHTGDHPYRSPAYEAHRAGRVAAARHLDATK